MPKVWKDDFNTKIIGDKRHWTEHPPNSPHEIHHQWRISLNENLLINIFENPTAGPGDPLPPGIPASFTFGVYYNMTVSLLLKTLISRLNYVPTYTPSDETSDPTQAGVPQQERSRLKARRVERVQRLLSGALARASANDAAPLQMKDLYLAGSYTNANKNAIDELCEQFWAAQQVLRWLCMPFLQYTDLGADAALPRPVSADLDRHLDGDNSATSIFGVRNLTYSQFAFLSTVPPPVPPALPEDLKAKYKRTREFAFNKGFFNKDNVVANYYKNLVKDIQSVLGAEGSAAISALSDKGILGGGNGYKCHYNPTTQQKSCIPGAPADYCANGGQTCTG